MSTWQLQEPVVEQPRPITSPVRVRTEWEPLREVIVGIVDDMRVPEWDPSVRAVVPRHGREPLTAWAGRRFPPELVSLARREVDGLADFLERQGVVVRRPDPVDHHRPVVTPHFAAGGGFHSAMPRDSLFAIDDVVLETPMAWRSRYFETFAFRSVLRDYFERGARWEAAPKPQLRDDLWRDDRIGEFAAFDPVIGEDEPLFDAADFVRIGDGVVVGQLSHVTNRAGVRWLQRHLGPECTVLAYVFDDDGPMHIDTTLLPMGEGRVLVNEAWVSRLPDVFAGWEVLVPPPSQLSLTHPLYYTSRWIHCNVLMLDEEHVLVEAEEAEFAAHLRKWGFEPIPLPFKHFQTFGGSFHCATLDVRRG
ncbi:amidinotransferase [Saccharothrix xinjiangensis]|uniref:Amidinotransferase n=1 Tax=Saccharothrix xinjiangensis TaxID=204798 RepID=A0ABV9Y993_9PSEU